MACIFYVICPYISRVGKSKKEARLCHPPLLQSRSSIAWLKTRRNCRWDRCSRFHARIEDEAKGEGTSDDGRSGSGDDGRNDGARDEDNADEKIRSGNTNGDEEHQAKGEERKGNRARSGTPRAEHPSGREWEHHALGPTIAAVIARGMIAGDGAAHSDAEGQESTVDVKAKVSLLRMLPYVINLNSQRARLETLIRSMESGPGARPLTEGFASLGLDGRWLLLFSSTTLGSPVAAGLRIRRIGQHIDPSRKSLVNFAEWSLIGRKDSCEAILFVKCAFRFLSPARIEITLKEHEIRPREEVYKPRYPGEKSVFPKDLNRMVQQLQRSLPLEFFDPSGKVDISYLDMDCRIARFIGKRLAGVRNVYIRDLPLDNGRERSNGSTPIREK